MIINSYNLIPRIPRYSYSAIRASVTSTYDLNPEEKNEPKIQSYTWACYELYSYLWSEVRTSGRNMYEILSSSLFMTCLPGVFEGITPISGLSWLSKNSVSLLLIRGICTNFWNKTGSYVRSYGWQDYVLPATATTHAKNPTIDFPLSTSAFTTIISTIME